MRLTIGELKQIIREEVERNNRWLAGFFMGGGISKGRKGTIIPPPGLGAEEEQEYYGKEQQEEPGQAGVRATRERDRGRTTRHDRRSSPGNPV